MSAPAGDELAALRAEIALLTHKTDAFGRALLLLAQYVTRPHPGEQAMSDLTDAVKARLVKLEATVDQAAVTSGAVAAQARADDQAALAEIFAHLDTIETKVEAGPHATAG